MREFQYESKLRWLPAQVFDSLVAEHHEIWAALEKGEADPIRFTRLQNEGMLLKFFLEQAQGDGNCADRSLQLVCRDHKGIEDYRREFLGIASKPEVEWITWGLSFASFRFHFLPVAPTSSLAPFCTSPMMVCCLKTDVIAKSGVSRAEFAQGQFGNIDWRVVESRIACLEKPLDVFVEPLDCQSVDGGQCN